MNCPWPQLLLGESERTSPISTPERQREIRRSGWLDLFLQRHSLYQRQPEPYLTMVRSLPEAAEDPMEVEARP